MAQHGRDGVVRPVPSNESIDALLTQAVSTEKDQRAWARRLIAEEMLRSECSDLLAVDRVVTHMEGGMLS